MKKIIIMGLFFIILLGCQNAHLSTIGTTQSKPTLTTVFDRTEYDKDYNLGLENYHSNFKEALAFDGMNFIESKETNYEMTSSKNPGLNYAMVVYKYNKSINCATKIHYDMVYLSNSNSSTTEKVNFKKDDTIKYEVGAGNYLNQQFKNISTKAEIVDELSVEFNTINEHDVHLEKFISKNIIGNYTKTFLEDIELEFSVTSVYPSEYYRLETRSIYDVYLIQIFRVVYQKDIYIDQLNQETITYVNPKYLLLEERLKLTYVINSEITKYFKYKTDEMTSQFLYDDNKNDKYLYF